MDLVFGGRGVHNPDIQCDSAYRKWQVRAAALEAALGGASLREIRRQAGGEAPGPRSDDTNTWPSDALPPRKARDAERPSRGEPERVPTLLERAEAGDVLVDIQSLATTSLLRGCLSRGIKHMRLASLIKALEEDLQRVEKLVQ